MATRAPHTRLYDSESMRITYRRVEYDVAGAQKKILRSRTPSDFSGPPVGREISAAGLPACGAVTLDSNRYQTKLRSGPSILIIH